MNQIRALVVGTLLMSLLCVAGCVSPMDRTAEEQLRDSLQATRQTFLDAIAQGEVEFQQGFSEVERELLTGTKEDPDKNKDKIEQLDKVSGPDSYGDAKLMLGPDLQNRSDDEEVAPEDDKELKQWKASRKELDRVGMSLEQAIRMSARNNIDLSIARLVPAIREAQVVQAEAAFDATFFAAGDMSLTDTPRPASSVAGAGGPVQGEVWSLETGIRKPFTTGGGIVLSTSFQSNSDSPTFFNVNPYWDSDITLAITQPLLRGFGEDVNRAEIVLRKSAQRQAMAELRASVIEVVNATEAAYWNLVLSRQQVLIRERLLKQTQAERKVLGARKILDVIPATYTEVLAREETRRLELIQARRAMRQASDDLKRLINDPSLPLSGETLLLPMDAPIDAPLKFSLLDNISTALRNRPEIQQALLQIKDASVRQRVADNGRLPVLDLTATMAFRGQDGSLDGAYSNLFDGLFIDYIVGLEFEVPIGNRAPEAAFRQREIERQQSVLNYQRTAQDVVLEVKTALRNLSTAYVLIGVTRSSRRAAAESLRALQAQQDAGTKLTPEFIDLKLRRQEALAEAERQEYEALTAYQRSISNLYRTTGTLLQRNSIDFNPDAD